MPKLEEDHATRERRQRLSQSQDVDYAATKAAVHADTSPSGITDPVTGQTVHVGDMDQGVFVDLTEQQANHLSYTTAETLMAYKDKEKARANA